MGDLEQHERPHRFLDFYSEQGVKLALDKYGYVKALKQKGFESIVIKIDTSDPFKHIFRLYFNQPQPENMLVELFIRKQMFAANPVFESDIKGKVFKLLYIEWFTLQNPTIPFSPDRPPLPSQIYPGLGMAKQALELFIVMCARLHCDGIMNIPERYHNAAIYSRRFTYFNPETQGKLSALFRDLQVYSLAEVAWAFEWNCVLDKSTRKPVKWFTDEQILGVRKIIRDYFKSKEYLHRMHKASAQFHVIIDEAKFRKKMDKYRQNHFIEPA